MHRAVDVGPVALRLRLGELCLGQRLGGDADPLERRLAHGELADDRGRHRHDEGEHRDRRQLAPGQDLVETREHRDVERRVHRGLQQIDGEQHDLEDDVEHQPEHLDAGDRQPLDHREHAAEHEAAGSLRIIEGGLKERDAVEEGVDDHAHVVLDEALQLLGEPGQKGRQLRPDAVRDRRVHLVEQGVRPDRRRVGGRVIRIVDQVRHQPVDLVRCLRAIDPAIAVHRGDPATTELVDRLVDAVDHLLLQRVEPALGQPLQRRDVVAHQVEPAVQLGDQHVVGSRRKLNTMRQDLQPKKPY